MRLTEQSNLRLPDSGFWNDVDRLLSVAYTHPHKCRYPPPASSPRESFESRGPVPSVQDQARRYRYASDLVAEDDQARVKLRWAKWSMREPAPSDSGLPLRDAELDPS